jgi:hypothetical protein
MGVPRGDTVSINLEPAVEAAAKVAFEMSAGGYPGETVPKPTWDTASPIQRFRWRETVLDIVTAAAPLIEEAARAQALEKAAQKIEAEHGLVQRDLAAARMSRAPIATILSAESLGLFRAVQIVHEMQS